MTLSQDFLSIQDSLISVRLNGGAEESRTPDILLAKQALYQLSYSPVPDRLVCPIGS
jgi:hypothetical protein